MPRMPKYLKREWAFLLDERGRKKYNELCAILWNKSYLLSLIHI